MASAAILGAGELGGALAHTLARRNRFNEIFLIDPRGQLAAGQALDIQQSGPIEGFDTAVVGGVRLDGVSRAAVIILADADATGSSTAALDEARVLAPHVPVVVATAATADALDAIAAQSGLDACRLIGSAPEALAAAVRTLAALELDVSPADVTLPLIGRPPEGTVLCWSAASCRGVSLATVLGRARRVRMEARLGALWPPGPYALASAAATVSEQVAFGSHRTAVVFSRRDAPGMPGGRMMAASARLGPAGVAGLALPELTSAEGTALESALANS